MYSKYNSTLQYQQSVLCPIFMKLKLFEIDQKIRIYYVWSFSSFNKENKVSPSSGLVSCRLEDQQLEGNSRREAIINEIFS